MDFPLGDGGRSAQRVLFVVRRGTTWSLRVTWTFLRRDMNAVARQHAIARRKIRAFRSCNGVLARDGVHIPPRERPRDAE